MGRIDSDVLELNVRLELCHRALFSGLLLAYIISSDLVILYCVQMCTMLRNSGPGRIHSTPAAKRSKSLQHVGRSLSPLPQTMFT